MSADDQVTELLTTIQEALDATGVYVAPTMRSYVDAADVARIEAAVAASPEPVFVVVHPFDYQDAFNGEPGDLLSRLHDRSGTDGTFIANAAVYEGVDFRLEARAWGQDATSSDTYEISEVGRAAGPDDLGAQLVTVTEAIADGTLAERYRASVEQRTEERTSTGAGSSGSADEDGGLHPAFTVTSLALALLVVVALVRRALSRRSVDRSGLEFTLPASVLERVRDAHDEQLSRRAQREVLALGERIDAADMDAERAPRSWQAALDHYDAARRVLGEGDTEVDVLDVVGAIVLAQRGEEALSAALAGRRFTPTTPCFLDPLHGAATSEGTIHRGHERVEVPLCPACRADLKKKRRPDILDVVRDGRPVHYFETDDEPWAATGYGALAPDLVERLHRRR